jgi:hypothetical protein
LCRVTMVGLSRLGRRSWGRRRGDGAGNKRWGRYETVRPDGSIPKVSNVGLGGKRIVRWSTEIIDVEVGVFLNWALGLVVAGIVRILASGISARTVASLKFGKAALGVRIKVRSGL